jgi:hypothetical protein
MLSGMASRSSSTIADLLDQEAQAEPTLKLDLYLDSLPTSIRDRVIAHLDGKMPSRRISRIISDDETTDFTISPSAIDTWRDRRRKAQAAADES